MASVAGSTTTLAGLGAGRKASTRRGKGRGNRSMATDGSMQVVDDTYDSGDDEMFCEGGSDDEDEI